MGLIDRLSNKKNRLRKNVSKNESPFLRCKGQT